MDSECKKRKKVLGLSLIEILVAITISVVTLTSSAVFASQLVTRAQTNFMEISALQLHNLTIEQLRLIESGLRRDAKVYDYNDSASYLFISGASPQPWQLMCDKDSTIPRYFYLQDNTSSGSVEARTITVPARTQSLDGLSYDFYRFPDSIKTNYGGFTSSNTEVLISIRKIFRTSADFGEYISFSSVVSYRLYNRYYFTKPIETRVIWALVCR